MKVAEDQKGIYYFMRKVMLCSSVNDMPIQGFTLTTKISSKKLPKEPVTATKKCRLDYYKYIDSCKKSFILIMEDIDFTIGLELIGAN